MSFLSIESRLSYDALLPTMFRLLFFLSVATLGMAVQLRVAPFGDKLKMSAVSDVTNLVYAPSIYMLGYLWDPVTTRTYSRTIAIQDSEGRTSPDGKYAVADGVILENKYECKSEVSADTESSFHSYSKSESSKMTASFGISFLKVGGDSTSGHLEEESRSHDVSITTAESTCIFESVTLNVDPNQLAALDAGFLATILSTPNTTDAWVKRLRKGFIVLTQCDSGGSLSQYFFTENSWMKSHTKDDSEMGASVSLSFSLFGVGAGGSSSESEEVVDSFNKSTSFTSIINIGGDPVVAYKGNIYTPWQQSLNEPSKRACLNPIGVALDVFLQPYAENNPALTAIIPIIASGIEKLLTLKGCTDMGALNYDANAYIPDGSCVYSVNYMQIASGEGRFLKALGNVFFNCTGNYWNNMYLMNGVQPGTNSSLVVYTAVTTPEDKSAIESTVLGIVHSDSFVIQVIRTDPLMDPAKLCPDKPACDAYAVATVYLVDDGSQVARFDQTSGPVAVPDIVPGSTISVKLQLSPGADDCRVGAYVLITETIGI